jgi:hypothetical protein
VRVYNLGPQDEKFDKVLYPDIVQISNKLDAYMDLKHRKNIEKNEGDMVYLDRVHHFRNM